MTEEKREPKKWIGDGGLWDTQAYQQYKIENFELKLLRNKQLWA